MKALRALSLTLAVLLASTGIVAAQTWTPITNQPPNGAGNPHLLTDGRVMVQGDNGNDWWALTRHQRQLRQWNLVTTGLRSLRLLPAILRIGRARGRSLGYDWRRI